MIAENMTRLQITLRKDILQKLDEAAARKGITRSAYIAVLVTDDHERQQRRNSNDT